MIIQRKSLLLYLRCIEKQASATGGFLVEIENRSGRWRAAEFTPRFRGERLSVAQGAACSLMRALGYPSARTLLSTQKGPICRRPRLISWRFIVRAIYLCCRYRTDVRYSHSIVRKLRIFFNFNPSSPFGEFYAGLNKIPENPCCHISVTGCFGVTGDGTSSKWFEGESRQPRLVNVMRWCRSVPLLSCVESAVWREGPGGPPSVMPQLAFRALASPCGTRNGSLDPLRGRLPN